MPQRLPADIGRRLLLLVAVSFLPLFLLIAWNSQRTYDALREAQTTTQLEVARGVASAFTAWVRQVSQANEAIAGQIAPLSPADAGRTLRTALTHLPELRALAWTNAGGQVIAASESALVGTHLPLPDHPGAIGNLDEPAAPAFSIVTPIHSNGAVRGLLVARIDAEALGRVIFTVPRPEGGAYSLFDRQGRLVYRNPQVPMDWEWRARWREGDEILHAVLTTGRPQAGVATQQPLPGEWLVARFPAGDTGWVAGASQPLANTLVPLRQRELQVWTMALGVAVTALFAAWRVGLSISRPLTRLAADALAGGEALRRPEQAGAPGEVRRLRGALLALADGMEQRAAHLRASEERFRRAVEEMPVPVLIYDDHGTVLHVSRGWTRFSGYTLAEIPTIDAWTRQAYGQRHAEVESYIARLFQLHEAVQEGEWTITAANHEQRIWEFWSAPLGVLEGRRLVISTAFDVTERRRAEESVRASEEKFRALFEQSAVGMARLSAPALRWIDVNQALGRMLGYTTEQLLGSSWHETVWDERDDSPLPPQLAASALEGYTVEVRLRHREGRPVWTRITLSPIRNKDRSPDCIIAVVEDIDERKHVEERQRLSEEKFQKAFASNPASITLTRLEDGRYTDVNETWCTVFGYSRAEAIGHSSEELHIWPDHASRMRMVQALSANGTLRGWEQVLLRRTGQPITVFGSGEVITVGGERLALFSLLDITERKRTEQALRESEERFRVAQELSPDGFTVLRPVRDPQGHIGDFVFIYVNPAVAEMMGIDATATLGRRMRDVVPDSNDLSVRDLYRQVADSGQPGVMETPYTRHNQPKWFRIAVVPLASDIAILSQDITERRRAEEERERLITELRRSNMELQQFAYISSHDLQEPLRMVASYVQLLERKYKGRFDEQADRYIAYAVDGAHRMQKLIEGLLAYSRIGTRGSPFTTVAMNDVFDAAIANLTLAIRESGATVTRGELPTVTGDETQLVQLLQNLIGNAIKFRRPDLPPEVRVGATRLDKQWRFAVTDNGIGIAPEYFERIFQIFQRLHARDEYPGTGIGLALAQRIVDRHHGRLWVESTPGAGATFYFTLQESAP